MFFIEVAYKLPSNSNLTVEIKNKKTSEKWISESRAFRALYLFFKSFLIKGLPPTSRWCWKKKIRRIMLFLTF